MHSLKFAYLHTSSVCKHTDMYQLGRTDTYNILPILSDEQISTNSDLKVYLSKILTAVHCRNLTQIPLSSKLLNCWKWTAFLTLLAGTRNASVLLPYQCQLLTLRFSCKSFWFLSMNNDIFFKKLTILFLPFKFYFCKPLADPWFFVELRWIAARSFISIYYIFKLKRTPFIQ